jgi:hypothetical protein
MKYHEKDMNGPICPMSIIAFIATAIVLVRKMRNEQFQQQEGKPI